MLKKIKHRLLWLRNSGITQTFVGFVSFLIIAAVVMLFLEAPEATSGIKSLFSSLWFAIVTVTTVGYGDLSPVSGWGKFAAIVIMFIGILYIGVLTANITSWLVERNRRKVFGLVPIQKKEGHFLILGWRPGMADILKDILKLHNEESDYLVLVNTANTKEVNELKQDQLLKGFSFFNGDHTNKEVLQNACGQSASKVLILSDQAPGLSSDEVDFKAVLSTIAIKRLNPKIYAIVEIIQPKFGLYLQHVEVEEIILNRASSRSLLSNIALMSGLNNIFTRFFSMNSGLLRIIPIEGRFIGKTYAELKSEFNRFFILGLVENSGNLRMMKNAQMGKVFNSISIKNAIQALNDLKSINSNVPIFHPPPSYSIRENSGMIVLQVEGRDFNVSELSQETIIQSTVKTSTTEFFLKDFLSKAITRFKTWNRLVELLGSKGIEFYQYNNRINGVIYKNRKYPFAALDLDKEDYQNLTSLKEKKEDKKDLIVSKINQFLELSLDWDDFFDRLKREGMDFYLYRNKVYGIRYSGLNFSFNALGIASEIIDEIQKIKSAKTDLKGKPQQASLKQDYHSLAFVLNEIKSRGISIKPGPGEKSKSLVICGWKPQLPEMISFIISQYSNHEIEWNRLAVVADVDNATAAEFRKHFETNSNVVLYQGSIVDRELLKKAGIANATKVIILAETEMRKSNEEIDSQTVLAAMMIGGLNKKAYKVAEILDKRYKESLEQANVEEIYLDDEFTRIMLSNGSHGVGVTRVIRELVNFKSTVLRTTTIDHKYINGPFKQLIQEKGKPGELIIGLLEETGNINVRKSERIHQAQIQSNIRGQVEELIKVKELEPNRVVLAPKSDYLIPPNSKFISLYSSDQSGWNHYQMLHHQ